VKPNHSLSILIFILSLLVGCSTTTSDEKNSGKENKAAQINIRLGAAYLERKDIARAKQKFLLALKEGPTLPEAWYSMGYFYESTGNIDQAKSFYLKALQLAPRRGDVLNNYGTYLCRTGQYKKAIENFSLAVQDTEYLDSASAYENAGLCARKMPDVSLAIHYFNQALNEDPSRASSLIELAELHYQTKQLKLAQAELNQFLKVSTPTPQSYRLEKNIEKESYR
jgi:type IV pilus assembly protein PilF